MTKKEAVEIFGEKRVCTVWDDETEEWFSLVVDVVTIPTDGPNPSNYQKVLRHRLGKEGDELVANCNQLELPPTDRKYYKTDVAATEQLFRLIQPIPSPKAKPFKPQMV